MNIHVYEYGGRLFIATVGKTEAGFYIEVEPVLIPEMTVPSVASALSSARQRGNPVLSTPRRGEYPEPVVLRHTKARSWKDFERGARFWKVTSNGGPIRLHKTAHVSPDQGWSEIDSVDFATMNDIARSLVEEISQTQD